MGNLSIVKAIDMKCMADLIIDVLNKHGFVLQRYDSYSTNSIYLKLDYGVCNSIRISDHKGKQHLKYRYNLLKDVQHKVAMDKGLPRNYYPYEMVDELIAQVLKDRGAKLSKYNQRLYNSFMEKNKRDHRDSDGFWKDSKIVSATS